ncbi:MAG: lamin tail domain-containing protein [Microbacterium chocolatum]|nr:lamin tail domain-containing protein [Microbacterium chocolatum]
MSRLRSRSARSILSVTLAPALVLGLVGLSVPAGAAAAEPAALPDLLVTEIVGDNVGYDDYEFFEVHNSSDRTIDLDAEGVGFSYIFGDTDDRGSDVRLTVPAGTTIDAGETTVFWLSYSTTTVDSFARSVDDFRAHFAATQPDAAYEVVRVEGQAGIANGGNRGIRIASTDAEISRSFVPSGGFATDMGTTFRAPASGTSAAVLQTLAAPTPGILNDGTLTPPAPEEPEEPVAAPLVARDLLVTEFAPNNVGTDAYEYVEIVNTTARDIDLTDAGVRVVYDYLTAEKDLAYPAGAVVPAGGVAVLWLQYSPNTDGLTDEDFRAFYAAETDDAAAADYTVIPITGQAGFANSAERGIRLQAGDTVLSEARYLAAQVGNGLGVDYRLPSDGASTAMATLRELAPATPGIVDPEALVPAPIVRDPDPDLVTAPLQITEVAPDTANIAGADAYEFIEVYNATTEPIDFRDYSLKYLYPLEDLTNSNAVLWPATNRNAVIPSGGTIVFWIKNGANDALTAADFNTHFGSTLVADESLFEIASGGMANGSPRGLEIVTNTGFSVNRAYYNLGGVDDTTADQPVQYAAGRDDLTMQTKLGTAAATPGAVYAEQVEPGLMVAPADSTAPTVTDTTAAEIAPGADFPIVHTITDDTQVRTVTLEVKSNLDEAPIRFDLLAERDGQTYRYVIPAVDLTGKAWFEYRVIARDGRNQTEGETTRVAVAGVDTSPVRLQLEDGQWLAGQVDVAAGGTTYPTDLRLSIDGTEVAAAPRIERPAVFAFEASGTDNLFRNGVLIGDDILHVFERGTYANWETISVEVPVAYLEGDEVTIGVWAGTKAKPGIDLNENNDDFSIRGVRLILPDGRTLTPAGYDDPTRILPMGDSTGRLDNFDGTFTIPADARTAVGYTWDTTTVADGPHRVAAASGENIVEVGVNVDNTAPEICTDL